MEEQYKLTLVFIVIASLVGLPAPANAISFFDNYYSQNYYNNYYSALNDPLICEAMYFWGCDNVNWTYVNITTGGCAGYSGVDDVWVNETGDYMSGDLNISSGLNRINLSTSGDIDLTGDLDVAGHGAFGSDAVVFGTERVLNIEEYSSLDASKQGIVSVLKQTDDTSIGSNIYALWFESICDTDVECLGVLAGYVGNVRCKGVECRKTRGGYFTTYLEYAYHNITEAVGTYSIIQSRFNSSYSFINNAEGYRSYMTYENATYLDATHYVAKDVPDIESHNLLGEVRSMTGFKTEDFNSDALGSSYAFDFGDSKNSSRIRGNYSSDKWAFFNYMNISGHLYYNANVTAISTGAVVIWSNGTVETGITAVYPGVADDWVNETGDTMTDNLTMSGKQTRIKGGIAFVESFPDIAAAAEGSIASGIWGFGAGFLISPDIPRTINVTFQSLDIGGCTGFIYVNGTDAYGLYITELKTVSVAGMGRSEYETSHAYANITAVVEDAPAGSCSYTVDTTWRFGVANYPINSAVDVYKVNVDAIHVTPTGYEVIPLFGTVNIESVIGDKADMIIWYRWGVNS